MGLKLVRLPGMLRPADVHRCPRHPMMGRGIELQYYWVPWPADDCEACVPLGTNCATAPLIAGCVLAHKQLHAQYFHASGLHTMHGPCPLAGGSRYFSVLQACSRLQVCALCRGIVDTCHLHASGVLTWQGLRTSGDGCSQYFTSYFPRHLVCPRHHWDAMDELAALVVLLASTSVGAACPLHKHP